MLNIPESIAGKNKKETQVFIKFRMVLKTKGGMFGLRHLCFHSGECRKEGNIGIFKEEQSDQRFNENFINSLLEWSQILLGLRITQYWNFYVALVLVRRNVMKAALCKCILVCLLFIFIIF